MRASYFLTLLLVCMHQAGASPLPDYPFVYVRGTAISDLPPDVANVTFKVNSANASAAAAEEVVSRRSAEILVFLTKQDISVRDVAAHEITKEVRTTNFSNKVAPAILGYELSRAFNIRIRRLSTWPEISGYLTRLSNVGDLEVSFDRTDKEKLQGDLVAKAAANARDNADRLATAFGKHLGTVVAISATGDFGRLGDPFGFEGAGELLPPPPVEDIVVTAQRMTKALSVPATIRLSASVNSIFKLE